MDILLKTYKMHQKSVIASLKRSRKLQPGVKGIESYKDTKDGYYVTVHHAKLRMSEAESQDITKWLNKMEHIQCVTISETVPEDFKNNYKNRECRFIFDIDSTLTRGPPGIIAKEAKPILNLLKSKEYWIYFATGRTDGDVRKMIKYCDTEPQGIAENGGVIILDESMEVFGDKEEPSKAFWCLKERYKKRIRQDMKQRSRITEQIIMKTLTRQEYEKCTKKYKVDVLASKSSYHIVKKGVNKGTALRWLIHERRWNDDCIVCVGDSDLDVPMFREAGVVSFAVGNSSQLAKRNASCVLANNFEQGVREMFDVWFD